jgi:hypothetical protein
MEGKIIFPHFADFLLLLRRSLPILKFLPFLKLVKQTAWASVLKLWSGPAREL